MGGDAPYIPGSLLDFPDFPSSYTGQALRRPRVNDGATALEFDYDGVDIINVEEARSDIRSTTRSGYSSFDSQPGIQALLDSVGADKTLLFPPNGVFNLNGKMITTGSAGQAIISMGRGCELTGGGIAVNNENCYVGNLRITGTSTYGINISHLGWDLGGGYTWDEKATRLRVRDVYIESKTYGIFSNTPSMYNTFFGIWARACTTGLYVNHVSSDLTVDLGDWFLTNCIFTGGVTGIHIVKTGGFHLVNSKCQSSASYGLLIQPTVAVSSSTYTVQGIYISNSSFEDAGLYDVCIDAETGVSSSKYPRTMRFVGGTIHDLLVNKNESNISFVGVLLALTTTLGTASKNVMITDCENHAGTSMSISGSGTSYKVTGMNSSYGAYIKVGSQLKLYDVANPTGKVL